MKFYHTHIKAILILLCSATAHASHIRRISRILDHVVGARFQRAISIPTSNGTESTPPKKEATKQELNYDAYLGFDRWIEPYVPEDSDILRSRGVRLLTREEINKIERNVEDRLRQEGLISN